MRIDSDIHYYDSVDRKSKKSVSNKIAILFSSLVFSVTIIFFLVSPEFEQKRLIELKKEVISNNLELKLDMINRIAKFNKTNKDLDDDDLKKIYNLLPDDNSLNKQMASVSNLAVKNRILIKEFSMSESKSSALNKSRDDKNIPEFEKTCFDFSFSGNFVKFMSFFNSIENNIPLIDIKSLDLIKEKEEKNKEEDKEKESRKKKSENMLNCEVTFSLYHS